MLELSWHFFGGEGQTINRLKGNQMDSKCSWSYNSQNMNLSVYVKDVVVSLLRQKIKVWLIHNPVLTLCLDDVTLVKLLLSSIWLKYFYIDIKQNYGKSTVDRLLEPRL
jgi:uncharacterized membrane protein